MSDDRKRQDFVARMEREFKEQYEGPKMLEAVALVTRKEMTSARIEGRIEREQADRFVSRNQEFVTGLLMRAVRDVAASAYDAIEADGPGGSKRSM